jgi:hypothetical protein
VHLSSEREQRGANLHPVGKWLRRGGWPGMEVNRSTLVSSLGTALNREAV